MGWMHEVFFNRAATGRKGRLAVPVRPLPLRSAKQLLTGHHFRGALVRSRPKGEITITEKGRRRNRRYPKYFAGGDFLSEVWMMSENLQLTSSFP
jgi:hypothetical protein